MRVRLILFKDGRRLVKTFEDHKDAVPLARQLKKKGLKFRLVTSKVIAARRYPPDDDNLEARTHGKLWCPFCGDWSFFKVPKFKFGVVGDITDEAVFLNSCHRQDIKVCAWCHISEMDFDVRMTNGTFGEQRRRRKKKRKVR